MPMYMYSQLMRMYHISSKHSAPPIIWQSFIYIKSNSLGFWQVYKLKNSEVLDIFKCECKVARVNSKDTSL